MPQETRAGRVVGGRYRLDESLARGGFGVVWRARDLNLHVDVAVKEVHLPPAATADEHAERLLRARREARKAAALRDHPHIVTVHDMLVDDDRPWLVMRLVDGHSLEDRLRANGPLSEAETEHVARCLLDALGAAHAAGIVHRDIKPANVMLTASGEVLLTDFGIAVQDTDTALTTTGAVVGSLEYMAPERLGGGSDGPAGDLFSLGATLYQAAEGTSPFRRATPTATLTALLTEDPPPMRRAARLRPLIHALLAKNAEQRPSVPGARGRLDRPSRPSTVATPTVPEPEHRATDGWQWLRTALFHMGSIQDKNRATKAEAVMITFSAIVLAILVIGWLATR
ncbi:MULTISPECIES: serine/threonine-protein kinase [unclassified Streptomyces]|uniref:serine/threonine-protein kinase n=1 Tax=unclassified Streptomyces TaxID=2593676 RepID=UPI00278C1416|nr:MULTISPECIES: serine/threonine-protein kinase [unclassified Streptomyces]